MSILFSLAVVVMVQPSMYRVRMACEVSSLVLCHGCIGPGASIIDWNSHERIPFLVISFVTLMTCC